MANFDKNQWHQLYTDQSDVMSLLGTNLFQDGNTGSVFFNTTNTSDPRYRWQIFLINSTTYVLRNQDGGGPALLGTAYAPTEDYAGHTRGQMVKGNISDESVFWSIEPWGDGTFYMVNEANGTDWHLANHNGGIILDSNITVPEGGKPPGGQRWTLNPIENAKIDDERFSSVELPTHTVTSSPPTSPTGSPTGSPPATTSTSTATPPSSGLSTAAKAGIGAGIGGAAFLALVLVALFFWRRRQQKMAPAPPYQYEDLAYQGAGPYEGAGAGVEAGGAVKYEMYQDNSVKYAHEMPDAQEVPVELPSAEAREGGR